MWGAGKLGKVAQKKPVEYKKLKKRLERLVGAALAIIIEDDLRLEVVDRLLEVRRLLNGSGGKE